jgi:hypothetical protein
MTAYHVTGRHSAERPTPTPGRRPSPGPRPAPAYDDEPPATVPAPRRGGADKRPDGHGRRVTAAVLSGLLATGALLGSLSGLRSCGTQPPAGGVQAVRDVVALMETARLRTYTADYTTADGIAVQHVQAGPRVAYRSAVGGYLLGPDRVLRCRMTENPVRCDRAPGSDGVPLAHAGLVAAAVGTGFVPAEAVAAALTRAAGVAGARTAAQTRTVGALRTRCAVVTPAAGGVRLTACVTDSGVLALFEADGTARARMELVRYAPTAEPALFDAPRGARMVDVDALAP